jgi:hypothetical protein
MVDFQGRAVTVEGDPDLPCTVVLAGDGLETSVVLCVTGEGQGSVLRGVTIRNGTTGTAFGNTKVGGAMYTLESSPTIQDCIFEKNRAPYGGAVYARKGAPTFHRCMFRDNTAEFDGGGFQFSRTEGGRLQDCEFEINTAGGNGGAVHVFGGDPMLHGVNMFGNSAGIGGGGLNWSSTGASAMVVDASISGNDAPTGAGINVSAESVDLTLERVQVCENFDDQVAGNYIDAGGNCIDDVCDVDGDGTDDCNDGCPDDPDKTEPGDCGCGVPDTGDLDADGIPDCVDPCPTWPYDCSEDGQTIVVAPGQDLALARSKVPDGGTLQLLPGTFNQTIDFAGRPITIQGDSSDPSLVVLDGTGIADSSVVVMMNGEGPDSVLRGVTIRNGTAGTLFLDSLSIRVGGALHALDASPTIEDCVFIDNEATFGGAIYCYRGAPTIIRCRFESNQAGADAGALQLTRSTGGMVSECVFIDNFAVNNGGAVHLFRGNSAFESCEFELNRAQDGGGGISWAPVASTDELLVDGCTITDNQSGEGAGVRNSSFEANLLIRDSTICDNDPDNLFGGYVDLGGNTLCICPADLSGNGVVDGPDLGLWLAYAGESCTPGEPCPGDLDGDGEITGGDLGVLLSSWGACP